METTERRYVGKLECRAAADGSDDLVIVGYASVFDVETERWPGSYEVVRRGAFTETLKADDQVAYWVHDKTQPLARKSAGTLILEEDAIGLKAEIRMANTAINQDRYASVKRGDVKGMSIGFMVQPDGQQWSMKASGSELREITRMMVFDVGPHPDPQFPETTLEARSRWDQERPKDLHPAVAPVEVEIAQARGRLLSLDL